MSKSNINEFIKEAQKGNISIEEHTHKVIEEAEKINKEYHYFNTIAKKQAIEQAKQLDKQKSKKGRLFGLPISVKDCICTKGIETTSGSKILKNYIPPFDATCIEKIKQENGIVIGKTSQDEFGFGGFSTNVGIGFNVPKNPYDKKRSCGGSSGGAAGFTQKTSFSHIAVAESTGGSIVCPASFSGVIGFCPTYGRVSRYGLIDYGNSLDKIGPIAKSVEDTELMFNIIKGHDEKDSTSIKVEKESKKEVKRIGIIKESLQVDERVKELILKKVDELNIEFSEVSLPLNYKYGISTYYLIAMSEASTNLAKYCGIRYGLEEPLTGNFNEYFSKIRSDGFGKEAKRRIILGTFARMSGFRNAYYLKAMKVRTLLINEYKKAFKNYDVLVSPTMPIVAPLFTEIEKLTPLQNYMLDVLTVGPNLTGLPHLTTTAGYFSGLPAGIMFIANHLEEEKLFSIGKKAE